MVRMLLFNNTIPGNNRPTSDNLSIMTSLGRGNQRSDFAVESLLNENQYRVLGKKGEGTFSEVLKCQHIKEGSYWACKKMKQHYDSMEQVNNLREIQALRRLNPHPNVINLHEILYDKKTGVLVLICELMDMNIYELIRGKRQYLPTQKVKLFMYQLLKSIEFMHRNGIFHRDVKPENILIKDDVLKLADFGSCRSIYSKQPYTEYISTRWYRAPECLLTDGYYSYKMDIWSVGCVFFEIVSLHPLFPGSNEVDQIAKIHDVLGTPDPSILNKLRNKTRGMNFNFPAKKGSGVEKLVPHASQQAIDLIYKMCAYDPDERISAKQALKHPYFKELRDADKKAHANTKSTNKTTENTGKDIRVEITEKVDAAAENDNHKVDNVSTAASHSHNSNHISHHNLVHNKQTLDSNAINSIAKTITLQPQIPQKRKKRHKRISDQATMLPKVTQSQTTALNPSYPSTTFSTGHFPKLTATGNTTMLPSIANAYKTKAKGPSQATKTMFGHYQLPSIDRRGAGY
ncbi:MAPK/MAK/MRK overlapping kinase isoform X2 [Lingula anatina]|uniref:MAPK/MAK/MRK overlapping kinase isoform X2 n=1 Tax=Lingula anatina TaxID=7574 RepID=A0A1S3HFX1_LINAN|nr:MAPK/MAK/MRK overlapping kinase isoform X2 [Lingula anatina]|eukprot:XP_013384978.1 MAPK/MAK/MRK overlapping kinase isoform X2 [Lingula anatina]